MAPTPAVYVEYAGFWRRFLAAVIDGIVLNVALLPFAILAIGWGAFSAAFGLGPSGGMTQPSTGMTGAQIVVQVVVQVLSVVGGWLYWALMESPSLQATLGKMALGIVVTDLEGNRIGFGRATGRYFGKIVSAIVCYVGFIIAGFTERKQALHDMMAGCLVVCKSR
jgi:uncharacterized RDD family membrane protein YckC